MQKPWAPPGVALTDDQIVEVVNDPNLDYHLDRGDAEEDLGAFFRQAWHVIEPARPVVWGWVMDAISEHLMAITAGQIRKLLINVPPGTSKTFFSCIFWPAWEWGPRNMPHLRYIKGSYAENLSLEANRKLRRLIKSDWYQERWGSKCQVEEDVRAAVLSDQDAVKRFATTKLGWSLAISVDGATTGERGDRFIIDDPHNVKQAESDVEREGAVKWMFEAATSRHNDMNIAVELLIMQRLHERDCSGAILEAADAYDYEVLCIDAEFWEAHPVARKRRSRIGWRDPRLDLPDDKREGALFWPERYTLETWAKYKQKLSQDDASNQYAIAGQLQQWPVPRKGGMCDMDKARVMKLHELVALGFPLRFAQRGVRGWDLAGSTTRTSPYTAGVLGVRWGTNIVIVNVKRERVDATLVPEALALVADQDDATYGNVEHSLPQDPGQAGKAQVASLSAGPLAGHLFHFSLESGEKEVRFLPFAAQWNAGNVILVEADWNTPYLAEMRMFPAGRYKDQMDATSRMYARLLEVKELPAIEGGETIDLTEYAPDSWAVGADVWGG